VAVTIIAAEVFRRIYQNPCRDNKRRLAHFSNG
jgi:hypothetical protein